MIVIYNIHVLNNKIPSHLNILLICYFNEIKVSVNTLRTIYCPNKSLSTYTFYNYFYNNIKYNIYLIQIIPFHHN